MISLGFVFGLIATVFFLVLGKLMSWYGSKDPDDGDMMTLKWAGRGLMLLTIGIAAFGFWPYDMQYHTWQQVGGKVASISSRQVVGGGGDASETKFVITFAGSPQKYGCSDTRCADVHKGDQLNLSCIRFWQYASVPGYDCRYDQ